MNKINLMKLKMTINSLQFNIASPLYKAALDGFRKISICANALFSVIKEEGFAWKSFLLNNSYICKMYSASSALAASVAKKIFTISSRQAPSKIDDSNPSMETLHSSNKAWIQDHSLLGKSYPNLIFSDQILLDVIFNKDNDSKGVIQFIKKFCAHNGQEDLSRLLIDWEKAYKRQEDIQNRPQEIRKISSALAEKTQKLGEGEERVLLLLEKEAAYSTSSLSKCIKKILDLAKPYHHQLCQEFYENIKKTLQSYFNTNWKKRCFTEVQEEIRAILLEQYSELHQMGTLKHKLPASLEFLFLTEEKPSLPKEITSLAAVVWDLLLQNGLNESVDQPLSLEILNDIFEKEFRMIGRGLEMLALGGINQLIDNVGEETQLLLQLCASRFPQKIRGWLEITPDCDKYCRVHICVRDASSPRINMTLGGESTAIKKYSYNKVPKNLLQSSFFVDLLSNIAGDKSFIASEEQVKEFFSELGKPIQSYVQSNESTFLQTGMFDQIKTYCCDREESLYELPQKLFFQMRLHAFVTYVASVQKNPVISDTNLSALQNGIESLQAEAGQLHETKQISDQEYIETIATTLEVEEHIVHQRKKIGVGQEESVTNVIPPIIRKQLQNLFSTIPISELDVENIKNFATILLGKDMSEEIAFLSKELPLVNKKAHAFALPHVSFLKLVKTFRIDIGNLRASPVALFKLYFDINQLLRQYKTLITYASYIPYLSMLALYGNPLALLGVAITATMMVGVLHTLRYGDVILDGCKAVCNFHIEAYNFLLIRLFMRLVQLSDLALHWSKSDPLQTAKSFLTENISNKISFSLSKPLFPISPHTVEAFSLKNIPSEIAPLQRFYPHMRVIPDRHNLYKIRQIVFPKLSMGFRIEEHNGAARARLHNQSEFWLSESTTDITLESADFSHLLLENDRGDKKICIVPRSPSRLFLQSLLRFCNVYSRKIIDLLSDLLSSNDLSNINSLFKKRSIQGQPSVYYCDWVDGEIVSEDSNAVGYLIAHYIASGDLIRSQKLVDQLKTMKANGKIESPDAMLNALERVTFAIPRIVSPAMVKIILELCALCNEIPLQSIAFPIFLRAYQSYVESREEDYISYLSEKEESLLLHHLKDESGEILPVIRQAFLASGAVSFQTLSLLLSNMVDGVCNLSLFGKAGYIPASLKKYELQQKYVSQEGDLLSLLFGLTVQNLINPTFSFGKTWVNALKTLCNCEEDLFTQLPIFFSRNTKSVATKSEQSSLVILLLLMATLEESKDVGSKVSSTLLKSLLFTLQDAVALSVKANTGFSMEEKLSSLMQIFVGAPSDASSVNKYSIEKTYPGLVTRHLVRAGLKTVQNFAETQNAYKRQQELENLYWFPLQSVATEYVNLQNLEQNIVKRYREISDAYIEKQERSSGSLPELNFQKQSSMEEQIRDILNWYESGRSRDSNSAFYSLNATKRDTNLIQELEQTRAELAAMCKGQEKTVEDLLICPQQELSLLDRQIEQCGEKIQSSLLAVDELQRQIGEEYEKQSTIKKVGLGFLQYINSLIEVPTFGLVQLPENPKIDILRSERSELLKEVESIKLQKEKLFQDIITACKRRLSPAFNEIYTYFCEGKDTYIIKSMNLQDSQWKVIKEQLYRYMILQKYLSYAENIKKLYTSREGTTDQNIDWIGYELDQLAPSIKELPMRDIFLRSQIHLEKKLGRSLSPAIRDRISDIVGHSVKNYNALYQLALSA